MKKLILLITLGAGLWYWYDGNLSFGKTPAALDGAGQPVVWVFTFDACGAPCAEALDDLRKRKAPFVEKLIDPADKDNADVQFWQAHRATSFPLIVVGDDSLAGFNRPELANLLAQHFGDTYLHAQEQRYFQKHFNADGSPRIVMYATAWCGYCKRLRTEFQQNNIDFTEIDVEKSGEQQLLSTTMGIRGVPATWVGYRRVQGSSLADVKKAFK